MKKFILGFVTSAMLFGSIGTYAATSSKIDVVWNVKAIKFDGVVKNSTSKPFVYNGATYVPLRFVAENLNKEVLWDKATQSVLVNTPKPKGAYLGDSVKYLNYQENDGWNSAALIYNGKLDLDNSGMDGHSSYTGKDNLSTIYKHFMVMTISDYSNDEESSNFVEFPMKSTYSIFKTTIGLNDEFKDTRNTALVELIIDDTVVKTIELNAGDFPEEVSLNIKNAQKLSMRLTRTGAQTDATSVVFGNPVLQ